MRFLMPTVLLIGITSITGTQMLVPMDKQKYIFSIRRSGGAVIDVIVNAADSRHELDRSRHRYARR